MSYRFVTSRIESSSRVPAGFWVQCRGHWDGPFSEEIQAARAAAKHLCVSVASLKKQG